MKLLNEELNLMKYLINYNRGQILSEKKKPLNLFEFIAYKNTTKFNCIDNIIQLTVFSLKLKFK